jgi:hypothetical protein
VGEGILSSELLEQAVAMGGEDLLERSGGGDASLLEEDDVGGDTPDFGQIVGDVEDARRKGEQAREDVLRPSVVEGAERLVEEEQIGRGREGAGESDALALSAGKPRRRARGEGFGAEEMEHFVNAMAAGCAGKMADAEGDILRGGEMREERRLLGDESDGAPAGRDGDVVIRVQEGAAGESDAAVPRHGESGKDAEDGAFAGAGGSEENGPARAEIECGVDREMALTMADLDVRHGRDLLRRCGGGGARRAG